MKYGRKILKFICIMTALAFFASAYLSFSAFITRLPRGVIVNGVDVGNMTYSRAAGALRDEVESRLEKKRLRIDACGDIHEFAYPEIYYSDVFCEGLRSVRGRGEYFMPVHYYLNGAEEIARSICAGCEREKTEPYALFNLDGEPFTYYDGCDGIKADKEGLLADIRFALGKLEGESDCEEVFVRSGEVKRQSGLEEVKARTVKLASFTTYFDGSNIDRSFNIRLAAGKINGAQIPAGGEFSFNSCVGARTAENGFRQAKIIENGKFVYGVGGGVCQVSTTLYNAALLSGMEITEYHPHSLSVSYVAPSRDAMVSGTYCDLKFKNSRKTPIYVRVKCFQSGICCTFYGESDGYNYSVQSIVTGVLPKPEEERVEGEEDRILSYGKEGLESCSYLVKEKDGEKEEIFLRKDRYSPTADVVQYKKIAD